MHNKNREKNNDLVKFTNTSNLIGSSPMINKSSKENNSTNTNNPNINNTNNTNNSNQGNINTSNNNTIEEASNQNTTISSKNSYDFFTNEALVNTEYNNIYIQEINKPAQLCNSMLPFRGSFSQKIKGIYFNLYTVQIPLIYKFNYNIGTPCLIYIQFNSHFDQMFFNSSNAYAVVKNMK